MVDFLLFGARSASQLRWWSLLLSLPLTPSHLVRANCPHAAPLVLYYFIAFEYIPVFVDANVWKSFSGRNIPQAAAQCVLPR